MRPILICLGCLTALAQVDFCKGLTCHSCEYTELESQRLHSETCKTGPTDEEIIDSEKESLSTATDQNARTNNKAAELFYYCLTAVGGVEEKIIVRRNLTVFSTKPLNETWCKEGFFHDTTGSITLPPGFQGVKTCYCNTDKCNNEAVEGFEEIVGGGAAAVIESNSSLVVIITIIIASATSFTLN